jgi:hypothetical protein
MRSVADAKKLSLDELAGSRLALEYLGAPVRSVGCATSLTQIVEDVLDVSRIVSGKIRLDTQPVELPLMIMQRDDFEPNGEPSRAESEK